jgi:AcrR family transcriptional regulator
VTRRHPDDGRTRRRVIAAATRQFAAFGFKRVTIRAICKEAKANVAAVNYHFRDKLGLYREVLQEAAIAITETTQAAIREGHGLPAVDRLRAYIRVHCERMFAQGTSSLLQQLIHREMQEPTPALESLVDQVFKPRFEYLATILSELLALPVDDEHVVHCSVSIHTQIVSFRPSPVHDLFGDKVKRMFAVEHVINHIAAFSIAGIQAYKPARHAATRSA